MGGGIGGHCFEPLARAKLACRPLGGQGARLSQLFHQLVTNQLKLRGGRDVRIRPRGRQPALIRRKVLPEVGKLCLQTADLAEQLAAHRKLVSLGKSLEIEITGAAANRFDIPACLGL